MVRSIVCSWCGPSFSVGNKVAVEPAMHLQEAPENERRVYVNINHFFLTTHKAVQRVVDYPQLLARWFVVEVNG